ncbi:MAG: hypothetical protein K0R54_3973 [Clostridiaceae bacterium]|jgi:hypothetical protein|nr:hypothetical protein [Clostridiaceae bacterium]
MNLRKKIKVQDINDYEAEKIDKEDLFNEITLDTNKMALLLVDILHNKGLINKITYEKIKVSVKYNDKVA